MSKAVHLIANNVQGYGLSDSRCLTCSRVCVSSPSSRVCYRLHTQVKLAQLSCTSRGTPFMCKASSGAHRRNNNDFSRQNNRHGYSRNRNRQNEDRPDRDSFENLEESDLLSSRNGPLLSLSGTPKSHATATPGPREKEIVELFRKVQARLRERAAMKEDKKNEASQGQGKGNDTVDSLLKLLRKHSVEQGKRGSSNSSSSGRSKDMTTYNQPEQNVLHDESKSSTFFGSNSSFKDDTPEPTASSLSRPVSSFRRKSPVPRVRYQPVYSEENTEDTMVGMSINGTETKNDVETSDQGPALVPVLEPEPELEIEIEPKRNLAYQDDESSDIDEAFDDGSLGKQEFTEVDNLSSLKLVELRALAKSRGLKGFSKMKKSELLLFLSKS